IRFKGVKRIFTGDLTDRFLTGVRHGIFQEISTPNYSRKCYGLKGVRYIPLTRGASQVLDLINSSVTAEEELRFENIAEITNTNKRHLSRKIWEFGTELINNRLIQINKSSFKGKSTQFLGLTKKGFNYFHRMSEFATPLLKVR
ncbi:MAG: hypothetical protein HWN66_21785, partial [Candidatus Helarchaeota archaeon]|nr:hypothetical protein [Candidatus Helarchaeota archaeon]